jgi:hypothetical protein
VIVADDDWLDAVPEGHVGILLNPLGRGPSIPMRKASEKTETGVREKRNPPLRASGLATATYPRGIAQLGNSAKTKVYPAHLANFAVGHYPTKRGAAGYREFERRLARDFQTKVALQPPFLAA